MLAPRLAARPPVSPRPWIRHLSRHVPIAVLGDDPEGVHQVRVAAGRLAAWLELSGREVLRDDLRTLRRSAAAVRDCDVLLGQDLPAPFAARLHERRDAARTAMIGHLTGPHARALRAALGVLPPIDRRTADASLAAFRDRVRRRGDALLAHPAPDDETFHELRRAIRKLRYALEWLRLDSGTVKEAQQAFGDLNDLAVEARALAETGVETECSEYARSLDARRSAARRKALALWSGARDVVLAGSAP